MTSQKDELIQMPVNAGVDFTTHPNHGNSVLVKGVLDFRFDASDRLEYVEDLEGVL